MNFSKRANGRVLVIGAGVVGLTTALCLRRRGFQPIVVAEKFAPETTSNVAGALWEWPPSVCGRHHDERLLDHAKTWSMESYREFERLATQPGSGVTLRTAVFYFKQPVADNALEWAKMNELKHRVRAFRHSPELITEYGISPKSGVVDAYEMRAPTIDTDRYMAWLKQEATTAGCAFVQKRIPSPLREHEDTLRRQFGVDAIVNCSGLGSVALAADDSLSPHRGALIRVRNDGKTMPRVERAHCVANDPSQEDQDMVFIVPRGEDTLLLGGLVEADEWRTDINLRNYAPIQRILERCTAFLPALSSASIDPIEPARVGLRPFREQNARVEHETGTSIIHNYGHGGSGVTLSWGCAFQVADLMDELLGQQTLAYGTGA
ncbi:MAG: amino acid oxidase [Xanthomonadales bacterium]|nr:amino acid oxidase [Xanthomonadales bacterium]